MRHSDPVVLTTFVRRDTWIYSTDLMTPSDLSLLPHVDVIDPPAGAVKSWELSEL